MELPESLQKISTLKCEKLNSLLQTQQLQLPCDESFLSNLRFCFAVSEFISDSILQFPSWFIQTHQLGYLYQPFNKDNFSELFNSLLNPDSLYSESDFYQALRIFRRQMMTRIAWRDLCNIATFKETITELSTLADYVITLCIDYLSILLQKQFGTPIASNGKPSDFIVLALGKLGSFELNFSSDVDLIFCYSKTKPEFEKYFFRLAQMLINALSRTTVDGFVFRVDMRLRPYGSGGPIVCSAAAITNYYQNHGREWERFALAKARLINPSLSGHNLMHTIHQFVYRRYIDFSIIEALRDIKNLILRESHSLENNVKRGEGGIREVEFIVQVFQLIHGGKETWFQNPSIFAMLPKLADYNCLSQSVVNELLEAYVFLRTTEHHLQEMQDQQTQTLPSDPNEQLKLALSLRFTEWEKLIAALKQYRLTVAKHFNKMVSPVHDIHQSSITLNVQLLKFVQKDLSEQDTHALFISMGCKEMFDVILTHFQTLQRSYNYNAMHASIRPKLTLFLQQILPLAFETTNAAITVYRLTLLLEKIIRRSVYIVLLIENSLAMIQLIKLISISPWISEQLINYPFLLDELIDKKTLYNPYSTEKLNDQLQQHMLSIPVDDLEAQMDCLRRFKQIQVLRLAASDATNVLPLMKVSDHLSNTACVIVSYAQRIAWRTLVTLHGYPVVNDEQLKADSFAIVAYGKLGGIELGYASDLDLVFLHAECEAMDMTDGEKSISTLQFFLRMAQRIIHILNIGTALGKLYDVDTRLRPSGSSGLLVASIEHYSNYQMHSAWTWEHQALVRARMITGSKVLFEKFTAIRLAVLCKIRDTHRLQNEVSTMRKKMFEQQPVHALDLFDVSNDIGGIKDIEFIVQYLALNYAHQEPKIIFFSDNIRILDALSHYGILTDNEAESLSEIYRKFREITHRMALQNEKPIVPKMEYGSSIAIVNRFWQRFLGK